MESPVLGLRSTSSAYADLQLHYRQSLSGPQDDMWATFADAAPHHALLVDGQTAGFASINKARELLSFFVHDPFADAASGLFRHLIREMEIVAATPSTVDPSFLSLSLEAGQRATVAAIMYRHVQEPVGSPLPSLRIASLADLEASIAFAERAIGAPRAFLDPYYRERISNRELYLEDQQGSLTATGECRVDRRHRGYAHLGLIVDPDHRGRGLGTDVMHQLVVESRRKELDPVCSTESQNLAAQSIIRKAGFAARHRIFRVTLNAADSPIM